MKKGICSCCGKDSFYANTFFKLCVTCNGKRLIEKNREQREKKDKRLRIISSRSITPISQRELDNRKSLREVYEKMNSQEQVCSGCGTTNYLSRSHIIPRSRRKDLESDINNIRFYCMERADGSKGCHQRWEGSLKEKRTLNDFDEVMKYVEREDLEYYNMITLQ